MTLEQQFKWPHLYPSATDKVCPECRWHLDYHDGHCENCGWNDAQQIRIAMLAGRCANGAERDHGTKWHAVPSLSNQAVCGAEPGRRSVGWGSWHASRAVTCPRCLKAQESSKRRAELAAQQYSDHKELSK